jgi:hypothetical protein
MVSELVARPCPGRDHISVEQLTAFECKFWNPDMDPAGRRDVVVRRAEG